MTTQFTANVGNVGKIGEYKSKTAAIRAIRETIRNSGRADNYGFVLDGDGELVAEIGKNPTDADRDPKPIRVGSFLTLGKLAAIVEKARKDSPLGDDTVVHLCEMEREYIPFHDAKLEVDEDQEGSAVFIVSLHRLK